MKILYQNKKSGDMFDITTLVSSAKWSTKRVGSPASVDLSLIDDEQIKIEHGDIIAIKDGNTGLFYGYVFKYSRDENKVTKVTAYDQMRYLKNKDTYVFKGKRADEILRQIANDFKIKLGALANTGYVIPSMIEDSKTLFDIILKALDHTLINANQMYYLWDDYGSLRISNVKETVLNLIIGDGSLATGYTFNSDIDSDTANKIKLVRDNKDTGKREVYIVQHGENISHWGILQHYDKVAEELNKAQIEAQAKNILALKNRPQLSLDIKALSDLSVRAGRSIFIKIADVGVKGWYVIDECSHDLINEAMSLKLVVM